MFKGKENNVQKDLDCFKAELSEADFKAFSEFIYTEYGIKMPPIKRIMLQGRLLKRIRELNMQSYTEYKDYFFSKEGQAKEIFNFLNVVTTNKTDFFREPVHFDFLQNQILPQYGETNRGLKVWSAGCSSGEELYTISIVLNEFKAKNPLFNFTILGSDISNRVLTTASKGVYGEHKVALIPLEMKKKYFLKSKDRDNPSVRVKPELQKNIALKYVNLMDNSFDVGDNFDVIFCRNVLIYFDRATQERVINKLCQYLKPGGYFFIGHSESLSGMNVPLKHIKPTIFRKE
ncbi:CheR family methyltransferase [Carboxylicivirga caseinilyticus]|uniref:CheR family methyltransferase n=1 Tax=Carboxylicivirga caseinilyticus TaxID=3417572 RepID=UPI003D33FA13|nr:protein-glutamate O-methyltransferase CheR [Marinilabiliaceae bacterium A049]